MTYNSHPYTGDTLGKCFIVTNSHTNHAHAVQNQFSNVQSFCALSVVLKSTDTGTGQRNQSAQRVRITAPVGLWSDYRLFVFPSDYNVLGNHFISPPRVRHCPLVSTNTLSNDVSFLPLTTSKSQVSAIRADRKPVCVHAEEQRFRRRHACLLAVRSEDLPQ